MTKLFISDLHLHHTRPEVTGVFQEFIDELLALSTPNPELYILGDLFEFWIGDDYEDPLHSEITDQLKNFQENGYGEFPICVAKTQFSFSTDPSLKGAPTGHVLPIREVSLSSGAEFIVVVCGAIMTMPGLPRVPAADSIRINDKGDTEGLF